MSVTRIIVWFVLSVLISGCASLKKDAGFEIETTRVEQGDQGGVLPPWRCISVKGLVTEAFSYTVAMIEIPKSLSEVWKSEITGSGRSYKVGKSTAALECSVWRTAFYLDGKVEVFDAVMNPDKTQLFGLLPPGKVAEFNRGQWLVWFNDGKTVMTTQGSVVVTDGNLIGLGNQFFSTNPSPLTRYANLRRLEPEGRRFFEQLEGRYPVPLPLGDGETFSTQQSVALVGKLTKGETALDNLVTCGSASAVPSVTGTIVGVVFSLPRNLSVVANGCGKGAVKKEATQSELPLPSSSPTKERTPP